MLFVCDLLYGPLPLPTNYSHHSKGENHPGTLEHWFFRWPPPSAVALGRPVWSPQSRPQVDEAHLGLQICITVFLKPRGSQVLNRDELSGKGCLPAVPSLLLVARAPSSGHLTPLLLFVGSALVMAFWEDGPNPGPGLGAWREHHVRILLRQALGARPWVRLPRLPGVPKEPSGSTGKRGPHTDTGGNA